jgi:chromosome segregation ATPase
MMSNELVPVEKFLYMETAQLGEELKRADRKIQQYEDEIHKLRERCASLESGLDRVRDLLSQCLNFADTIRTKSLDVKMRSFAQSLFHDIRGLMSERRKF